MPKTADYYYDEAVPEILPKHSPEDEFPLSDIDLSDAWVVAIVNSGFTGEIKGEKMAWSFHWRERTTHQLHD